MEDKLKYVSAEIKLILLSAPDIITTSPTLGDGGPDYDNNAWA